MSAPLVPSWLSGQQDSNPLSPTGTALRWGVIATGRIARTVVGDLATLPDADLRAVSSREQSRADSFAAEFGFDRSYGDDAGTRGYERLLMDDAVDVVYLAAPHGQHHEIAKAALLAGKHVLVEKAFTINAREASDLVETARAQGRFLMEAMWSRFLPAPQRAFEIAASGEIGEIRWVSADLGFPAPYDRESRLWDPAAGGGALLDLTVYPLLWALGTLGYPESVAAEGLVNDDGVDAQNALMLGYADGRLASLTSSLLAHGPRAVAVAGSEGLLSTQGSVTNPLSLTIRRGADEPRLEDFTVVGRGYAYELREVTRCIQQGLLESPTMPWAHSVDTMRLFDGVRSQLGVRYPNDARR